MKNLKGCSHFLLLFCLGVAFGYIPDRRQPNGGWNGWNGYPADGQDPSGTYPSGGGSSGNSSNIATNLHGQAFPSLRNMETVGNRGDPLMKDFFFQQKLSAFTRERVPERTVHAKGTGAHGYFVVTNDVSRYTRAKFLNGVGKLTPTFVRFSTSTGALGSADTAVDQHGFATKFYTEDGIHDILALSIEPFPIRDPMLFPDVNRSRKKNPQSGLPDPESWWDFTALVPESIHHVLHLFSDRGRPDSYRRIAAFAVNVFKLQNATGGITFAKFHWRARTPFRFLTYQQAKILAGSSPEFKSKDLFDSIKNGVYPKYTLYIQTMTPEELMSYERNPFDATRSWPMDRFPLRPIGDLTLNRNPENFFAEVEQAAFAPSNLVPGISPSSDRILGGRMFVYEDAHRYRFGGPNFGMLPINQPINPVNTYIRDGFACFGDNGGGSPNYYPNSFGGPQPDPSAAQPNFLLEGVVGRTEMNDDDPFEQPRQFLQTMLSPGERERLIGAMADWLKEASATTRERVFQNAINPVSLQFAGELRAAVDQMLAEGVQKETGNEL